MQTSLYNSSSLYRSSLYINGWGVSCMASKSLLFLYWFLPELCIHTPGCWEYLIRYSDISPLSDLRAVAKILEILRSWVTHPRLRLVSSTWTLLKGFHLFWGHTSWAERTSQRQLRLAAVSAYAVAPLISSANTDVSLGGFVIKRTFQSLQRCEGTNCNNEHIE